MQPDKNLASQSAHPNLCGIALTTEKRRRGANPKISVKRGISPVCVVLLVHFIDYIPIKQAPSGCSFSVSVPAFVSNSCLLNIRYPIALIGNGLL